MGFTIADQTWQFFFSILFGMGLGVLYDLFRIFRVAFPPGRTLALFEDLIWWLMAGVLTVLFCIAEMNGQIRIFALMGEGIGFLLYHLTIGVLVLGASRWIIGLISAILRFLYRITLAPIGHLIGKLWGFVGKKIKKTEVLAKKSLRKRKFRLKRDRILLYNLLTSRRQEKDGKGVGPRS